MEKLNNYLFKLIVALLLCMSMTGAEEITVKNTEICASPKPDTAISKSFKWYRTSAEKKALYNQAYFAGSKYIQLWVKSNHPKINSWGVILDIDETVLDNSWYEYACGDTIHNEVDFSRYVVNAHKSVAEPGAAAFTNLVHKLGGYVSMVSNRDGTYKDSSGDVMETSIANLKAQNIYFDQLVLSNNRNSKKPRDKNQRFDAVISGKYDSNQMTWSNKLPAHKVITYFGDNIQDFPGLTQDVISGLDSNDMTLKKFGNGYFILPNPMYGSWMRNGYK